MYNLDMRIFSPIPICIKGFASIQFGLLARQSPITIAGSHGHVSFLPVQVSNLKGRRFDSRILFNAYPTFEIYTIQDSFLPHVYDMYGGEVDVSCNFKSFDTRIHEHIVRNIVVSPDLKNYDILLCSKSLAYLDYVEMS